MSNSVEAQIARTKQWATNLRDAAKGIFGHGTIHPALVKAQVEACETMAQELDEEAAALEETSRTMIDLKSVQIGEQYLIWITGIPTKFKAEVVRFNASGVPYLKVLDNPDWKNTTLKDGDYILLEKL